MKQSSGKKVREDTLEALPLNVIRSETVLSKLPIHNLSKTGQLNIEVIERNNQGEITLNWKVFPNSSFGVPRQLAYKLDTLVVNRKIEEVGRPVPKVIRLGSLREICKGLGLNEGQATRQVRNALRQNAFTGITAKLTYKGADGRERTIEISDTRYGVTFAGEKLPDGGKADAVYLTLHSFYQEVLNNAVFRPLDYDYLKELSPASQRFYEIVSYKIFAALHHKRSDATLLYSDYCMYSGQARYFNREQARKQMYKLHQPHLKSGYLTEAQLENVPYVTKEADWLLRYVPGPKAKAEYKTFTSKGNRNHTIDVELESVPPQALPELPQEPALPPLTDDEQKHVDELTGSFGVSLEKAETLVRAYPLAVKLQLEVFPYRGKNPKDRSGWIIRAIEKSYPVPPDYEERRRREEAKIQADEESRLKHARSRHEDAHRAAYLSYLEEREGELQKTHHEASRGLGQRSILEREKLELSSRGNIREIQLRIFDKRESRLNRFYEHFKDYPECKILDFWQWDGQLNPKSFTFE